MIQRICFEVCASKLLSSRNISRNYMKGSLNLLPSQVVSLQDTFLKTSIQSLDLVSYEPSFLETVVSYL